MLKLLSPSDEITLANLLVEHNVVQVRATQPFRHRNGKLAPIKLEFDVAFQKGGVAVEHAIIGALTLPEVLPAHTRTFYHTSDMKRFGFVGVPTGGSRWAASLADQYGTQAYQAEKLIGQYVGFTLSARPDKPCIAIEDVVNEGGSTAALCRAIQATGQEVRLAVGLFSYERPTVVDVLACMGVAHRVLITWRVLREVLPSRYSPDVLRMLDEWYANPALWSRRACAREPQHT